jgi:hypothetical protein
VCNIGDAAQPPFSFSIKKEETFAAAEQRGGCGGIVDIQKQIKASLFPGF